MAKKTKIVYFCDKDETHIVEKPADLIPVKIGDYKGEYCKVCADACKPAPKPAPLENDPVGNDSDKKEPGNPIVPGAE